MALMALVRIPPGDLRCSLAPLTRFEQDRPAALQRQAFPARPNSLVAYMHEIEFQDYSTVGDRGITLKSLSRTGRAVE